MRTHRRHAHQDQLHADIREVDPRRRGAGELILTGDLADYQWSLTMPDGTLTATFVRKMVSLHRQYTVTVDDDPRVAVAIAIPRLAADPGRAK